MAADVIDFKPRKPTTHGQPEAELTQVTGNAPDFEVFKLALETLAFYADQGFDHGVRAKAALKAMMDSSKEKA